MQVSLDASLRRPVRFAHLAALLFVPAFALTVAATPALGLSGAGPTLRALSGAGQQTTYASSFAKPLTVWVCDPGTERSLAGVHVNFTASAGIRLSESSVETNDKGLAFVVASGLDVGTSSVKAEIAGDSSSAVSFDNLVVNKAVLTIVPVDLQSTVGVIPPITEYTIQGFVNGDTEDSAQISGVPVLSTIATENSPDANYAIKGGVGTLESPRYTFKPGFGALVLRGMGKASRPETAKTAPSVDMQDGSPVVQSAIQPVKADAPAAVHPGTVHKANVLPSIEVAHPTPLLGSAVHSAVSHQLTPMPSGSTGGVVRPGVLGQAAKPASTLAGEFVQGVHSALPDVTQGPVSPKTSRIRKALNPPTPN
jgi:hypothetical protein